MSGAGVSDTSSLEHMIRQDRLIVAFGLLAVIALSWIYLVTESAGMRSMLSQADMHAAMGNGGDAVSARDYLDFNNQPLAPITSSGVLVYKTNARLMMVMSKPQISRARKIARRCLFITASTLGLLL